MSVVQTVLIYAFAGSIVFAVGLAVLAARKPNGIADRISMVVSMTGLSVAPYALDPANAQRLWDLATALLA